MSKLSFGKYAGMDISDVPKDYLEWLRDSRAKDLAEYESELRRRDLVETASMSMLEKIVQSGYRAMASKMHPDAGGSADEFHSLQAAYEQLKVVLKEVAIVQGTGAANNKH